MDARVEACPVGGVMAWTKRVPEAAKRGSSSKIRRQSRWESRERLSLMQHDSHQLSTAPGRGGCHDRSAADAHELQAESSPTA